MSDSCSIKKYLILGAAIALANLLVYRQTVSFAPINLDEQQLLSDKWQHLKTGGSAADAFNHDVFKDKTGTFYRPVLTLSFIADARLSGEKFEPAPFHRSNLLLQILSALLAFILLSRLGYAAELAAAGALLFSLHPALAAASGWIPGRNDSLLFVFSALALLLLNEAARRRNFALFLLHLASFLLALLTKETAAVLLPLFPVWVYVFTKETAFSGNWKPRAAAAGLGWVFCAGFYLFLRSGALNGAPPVPVTGLHGALFRAASYAAYIFIPFNIPVYAVFRDLPLTRVILANAAGLLLFAAAWRARKGLALPLAMAAAGLFIIPSVFSDRFLPHRLYLPVFFIALAVTEAARAYYPARRAIPLAITAASLCLGVITYNSLRSFKDPDVFWQSSYAASPSCGDAEYELGYSAQLRGDAASAEKYYLKAIVDSPQKENVRLNLGVIYKQAGRYEEALRFYEGELRLSPGNPTVIENIGNLMAAKGDFPRAIGYYKLKIAAEPGIRKTYERLIFCLVKTGNLQEAAKYRQLSLALKN